MKDITEADFADAANLLGCDVATIKAVCAVEAPRGGFLDDGRPVVLFEGHKFSRMTGGRFDRLHPTISYPSWTRAHYAKGATSAIRMAGEWARLAQAVALDRDAALKSASWGRFQIMGFNHDACGFDSVQAFVNAMYMNEGAHLKAFVMLVKNWGIDDELRHRDWAAFARRYNGPAYEQNAYDTRLAAAYEQNRSVA
ncbi:MAG: N-acetylmuramidase family protein [Zoogloeaceae bacterium]|nr:N-acetylmuramidase family protein [Rhodocyclaceae bacterium]MCP5233575.1 N-acetylmuramidase family protein [Zoogloeaceae bacterium]